MKIKPCEYCEMVNRNLDVASNIREALDMKNLGFKIEYPFISMQIIENTGRGISSRKLTAKFCPNCGRKLNT